MNQEIGAYISFLRIKKGLTQTKLAEIIGVNNRTISKWETGEGLPDVSLLKPLANALDTSVDAILNGGPIPITHLLKSLGSKGDIAWLKMLMVKITSVIISLISLKLLYQYVSTKHQIQNLMTSYNYAEGFSVVNQETLFGFKVMAILVLFLVGFSWLIDTYYRKVINKNLNRSLNFPFVSMILRVFWCLPLIFISCYEILPLLPFIDYRLVLVFAIVGSGILIFYQLKKLFQSVNNHHSS